MRPIYEIRSIVLHRYDQWSPIGVSASIQRHESNLFSQFLKIWPKIRTMNWSNVHVSMHKSNKIHNNYAVHDILLLPYVGRDYSLFDSYLLRGADRSLWQQQIAIETAARAHTIHLLPAAYLHIPAVELDTCNTEEFAGGSVCREYKPTGNLRLLTNSEVANIMENYFFKWRIQKSSRRSWGVVLRPGLPPNR